MKFSCGNLSDLRDIYIISMCFLPFTIECLNLKIIKIELCERKKEEKIYKQFSTINLNVWGKGVVCVMFCVLC